MNLHIRPAAAADAGTIVEFNRRLAQETEGLLLATDVLDRGVQALLTDPNKGFYTLAERNGLVVGQTLITREWSDWRNGWFWWLQSVYVLPAARKLGVFAALFQHLLAQAANDPEVIGLRLYVERGNAQAMAAYRRLGMHETQYKLLELSPIPGR